MLLALASLYETAAAQPHILLADVVVDRRVMRSRSVVVLLPGSARYLDYGGGANLEPIPVDQQGDPSNADHSVIGN